MNDIVLYRDYLFDAIIHTYDNDNPITNTFVTTKMGINGNNIYHRFYTKSSINSIVYDTEYEIIISAKIPVEIMVRRNITRYRIIGDIISYTYLPEKYLNENRQSIIKFVLNEAQSIVHKEIKEIEKRYKAIESTLDILYIYNEYLKPNE